MRCEVCVLQTSVCVVLRHYGLHGHAQPLGLGISHDFGFHTANDHKLRRINVEERRSLGVPKAQALYVSIASPELIGVGNSLAY